MYNPTVARVQKLDKSKASEEKEEGQPRADDKGTLGIHRTEDKSTSYSRPRLSDSLLPDNSHVPAIEESHVSLSPLRIPLSSAQQIRNSSSRLSSQVHNDVSCENSDCVFVETIEQTRTLRRSQDIEYLEALNRDQQRDQEREAQRLALERSEEAAQLMEERRLKALMERRSRLCPEPLNGYRIQLKYCDGSMKSRRFLPTQSLQNLMDYAGNDDSASEIFWLSMPSAGTRLSSTMTGTLEEHNLTTPCTLFVQWLEGQEVEQIRLNSPNPEPNMDEWLEEDLIDQIDSSVNAKQRAIEILTELTNKINPEDQHSSNMINSCRDDIYGSARRAFSRCLFDPYKPLGVVFMDLGNNSEGAVDDGGPTREFCHLLMKDIQSRSLFEGPDHSKLLALDSHAISKGDYKLLGKMISICLIHGGVAPHFFAPRLFSLVVGEATEDVDLTEIVDEGFRSQLQKIQDAITIEETREALEEASNSLSLLGSLNIQCRTLEDRETVVQCAAKFYLEGRLNAAMEQFVDGLGCLGLHAAMKTNSKHLRYLFLAKEDPLTAQDLIDVFSPHFAEQGSNRRHNEIRTYAWFRDFLLDVEGGEMQVDQSKNLTLQEVLAFASGLEELPPLGFKNQPIIEFMHTDRKFPEANTCDVVLRLPILRSYEEFCNLMCSGILQATEFGMT
ncbi:G2/M phase-specific E3 ubiquitin-protein ligase-like [Onychostoma macrolepis]|uniref:G2/M phase-specific E3 ubiquitin-protein ligase-like n=1 Tax=Onychostoma macrolepis TaxID=369639 RepID=UPI00272CD9F4|nr:G2/M phase-specific E3 ubiquitin-protein ligase-like [Onychostoma macrolepis]